MKRAFVVGAMLCALASPLDADIEGTTFSSKTANVRMTLPRGWRWSDQATYPGIVMRMNRTRPRATMLLAVDALPGTIDPSCQDRPPVTDGAPTQPYPLEMQVLCEQGRALVQLGFVIGPIKEASRPWFDYSIEGHELRQGLVVFGDRVVTLVLAADTAASRAQYARTFDKTLRSLRALETTKTDEATGEEVPVEETLDAGVPE